MILYLSKLIYQSKVVFMKSSELKRVDDLFIAILEIRDKKEAKAFFRDLLTGPELIEFSKRWQTARMLNDNISYATIVEETGLSSTTVARVSKWLKKGMGGYKLIITRLQDY